MKKLIMIGLLISTVFLSQGLLAISWGSVGLNKAVQLDLTIVEIVQLNVNAGTGDLLITGKAGQSQISVIAKVFAKELTNDDYTLSLKKEGDQAILIARFNDNNYNNQRIDLEITMPASLALLVDDRTGDISINSVSNGLTLNDRSGDIELKNIVGLVQIEDRSGDLVGEDLRGDVTINDRSGEIRLRDVNGDVHIDDTSGDIRATNITGIVTVDDSSGDINVNGAVDFKLKSDGSGDVSLRNITRDLK
jgi:hypothetical protein